MNEEDLMRMVVRLVGDGSSYTNMMNQAVSSSESAAKQVERHSTSVQKFTKTISNYASAAASKLSGLMGTLGSVTRMGLGSVGAGMLPGLLGLGGGLAAVGGMAWGVQLAGQAEQAAISFEVMLGDAATAKSMLADLTDFAAKTPFEMPGLRSAAQMMLQFGVAQNKIMPTLKALGDVAAGDQNKLNGLTYAYSQMQATGRLMGQDLMQMINWGFNPLQEISRKTGKSMAQLKAEMEAGRISAQMVEEAFLSATGPGGKFNGMMQRQSETIEGLRSTLADTIKLKVTEIGQTLIEKLNIKGFMKRMIALAEQAGPVISSTFTKIVDFVIPVVSKIGTAIGWVFETVKPYFIMLGSWVATGFEAFGKAFTNIQRAVIPLLPSLSTVKAYIVGIWEAIKNWTSENRGFLTTLITVVAAVQGFIVAKLALASAIGTVAAALALLLNPIGLTVTLLTTSIGLWTTYTESGRSAASAITEAFGFLAEQFKLLVKLIQLGEIEKAWKVTTTTIALGWAETVTYFKQTWIGVKTYFAQTTNLIGHVFAIMWEGIKSAGMEAANILIRAFNIIVPKRFELPEFDTSGAMNSIKKLKQQYQDSNKELLSMQENEMNDAAKPAEEARKAWEAAQAEAVKAVEVGQKKEAMSFNKTWLGMGINAASWAADQIQQSLPQSTAAASMAGQMAGQAYNKSMGTALSAIDAVKAGSTKAYELLEAYRSKFATPNNVNQMTQTGTGAKETLPTLQGILTGINTLVTETKNKGKGVLDGLLSTAGLGDT